MSLHWNNIRRRILLGFSYTLLGLVVLLILASASLTAMTATESGSQWLLRQAQEYIPGKLHIDTTQGDLMRGLSLSGIDYQWQGEQLHINRLNIRLRLTALLRQQLHIERLHIDGLQYRAAASSASTASGLSDSILLPLVITLEDGRVKGMQLQLGQEQYQLDEIKVSASAGPLRGLELKQLAITAGQMHGQLQGQLSLRQPFAYQGKFQWDGPFEDNSRASGAASFQGDSKRLMLKHRLLTPVKLQTQGEVQLDQPVPVFMLSGQWQGLQWPLAGPAEYLSRQGQYTLQGSLADYHLTLSGPLQAPGLSAVQCLPDMQVQFSGQGNPQGIKVQSLAIAGLDGQVSATGDMHWSPGFTLALDIQASELDPSQQWPGFPAKLALTSQLAISSGAAGTRVSLANIRLHGHMYQQPIKASGDLLFQQGVMSIPKAVVSAGANRLRVSGVLDSRTGLSYQLDAPDLAGLLPGLSGQLKASGKLLGSLEQPFGQLKLSAQRLMYGGNQVQLFQAQLNLDANQSMASRGSIKLQGIQLGVQLLDSLSLDTQGWIPQHQARLELHSDQGNATISLQGGYQNQAWRGQIDLASLTLGEQGKLGDWQLKAPVPLVISANSAGPAKGCWESQQREVCLDGAWGGDTARLSLTGKSDEGHAQGEVQLDRLTSAHADINGKLDLRLPDIRFIQPLFNQFIVNGGILNARLQVDGKLDAPRFSGKAALENGAVQVLEPGLELEKIRLQAQAEGQSLSLKGSASSGQGSIQLGGEVSLQPENGWPFNLSLKGQQFTIVRLPDTDISASPDLKIQGSLKRVNVSGSVLLPHVRITLRKLPPDVVRVSEDQVIVGVDAPAEKQSDKIPLQLNVVASLGDDVHFDGLGLETDLAGSLNLRSLQSQTLIGNGVLELQHGRYEGYGQKLAIQQGHLLFAGPLNNPELDIRATREVGDVTAGIELTGSAKSPQLNLFSQPAMSDAEVMSYLVTGKPLSASTSSSDSQALAAAAASLGINNPISQEISQALGVDIGVESGASDAETSVMVGKQLSPRLRVDYLYGMFTETAMVRFAYKLGKYLSLTGQSGEQQSIDLNYSIRRP